jgi:CHASE2 domain-containing sensor protein
MGKWVVLELDGDWETGFRATLEINTSLSSYPSRVKGFLPPNPVLLTQLQNYWQGFRDLGSPVRIKVQRIVKHGSINERVQACKNSARQVRDRANSWFDSEPFRAIADRLREELHRDEETRFSVRTGDRELQKLPWSEWNLFQRFEGIEPALSPLEVPPPLPLSRSSPHPNVKILAILGHSEGIDTERDRQILTQLPHAKTTFLVEPKSSEINQQLWDQQWDIIFFAGHSETEGETGRIYLNSTESITVDELWYGLKKAVERGLKLAIFNSCDGLGLARQLNDSLIPLVIVMREVVPDRVAVTFLRHFLTAFARGESLYAAAREAREQLQGLRLPWGDSDFECPCATWLPVIYENPAATGVKWLDLYEETRLSPPKRLNFSNIALTSLACTLAVMGVRGLGVLQPFELPAYDHLLRQRSAEPLDSRILVVEIAETDTNQDEYPLQDRTLAQLLQKLEEYHPQVIGLNVHRYEPRGVGRSELIAHLQDNSHLITVCGFDSTDKNHAPPPEFTPAQVRDQMGFSNLLPDPWDSPRETIRRQLLSYNPHRAETSSPCTTPWSLSVQLAHRFLEGSKLPSFSLTQQGDLQVGSRILKPLPARFGGYQRLEGHSNQIAINYRSRLPGQRVTVQDVLSGNLARDRVEGKVVLIGNTSYLAGDEERTPYGKMPTVWIQAHLTSQLLSAALDNRPLIWVLPQWGPVQWGDALWVFAWSLLGGGLSWVLRKRRILLGLAFGALLGLLYHLCLILLAQGGWMPLIPSALAVLATGSWLLKAKN